MKLSHRIHVCLIIFLIHYFDIINLLKTRSLHFDSIMNPTNYESISVTWVEKQTYNGSSNLWLTSH